MPISLKYGLSVIDLLFIMVTDSVHHVTFKRSPTDGLPSSMPIRLSLLHFSRLEKSYLRAGRNVVTEVYLWVQAVTLLASVKIC